MADQAGAANDKVAVITGASSGIGHALAVEFAKQGYNVALTARRRELLETIAEECEYLGVETSVFAADMADEDAVQEVAEAAVLAFGHFDVWVNNAAVHMFARFEDIPRDDLRRLMDINVYGYVNGMTSALRHFRKRGQGTLINVTSMEAVIPQPYASAYVASKYAVRGLTESVRMELEAEGCAGKIHVCNVMPASTDTNLYQNAANYTTREVRPLEPIYDPVDVAGRIVQVARRPRRETIIGAAGKMAALDYAIMPGAFEKAFSKFVRRNQFGGKGVDPTSGNLYDPLLENAGLTGGWRKKKMHAKKTGMLVALSVIASLGIVWLILMLKKKRRVT